MKTVSQPETSSVLLLQEMERRSNDDDNLQRYAVLVLHLNWNIPLVGVLLLQHECSSGFVMIRNCSSSNDNSSSVVTRISAYQTALSGTIPEEIGLSTFLTSLELYLSRVHGEIPASIEKMTAL